MPKLKTNRGAAKRFKKTAKDKFKVKKAYRNHILTTKSTKVKRKMRKAAILGKSDTKSVAKLLPYA